MRFRNYFNKRGKHKRIYSLDELYNMNLGDFIDKEDELDYQDRTIGLPFEDELKSSNNVRYVQGFTQNDGNTIPSHWEGINDIDGSLSDLMPKPIENIPSITGGIAGNSVSNGSRTGGILGNLNSPLLTTFPNQNNTFGSNSELIKPFAGLNNTWNINNNNLNNQNENNLAQAQENILSGYVTNDNSTFNNGKTLLEGYITNTPDVVESEQQNLPTTYWDSKGNAQKVDENGYPVKDNRSLWQKVSDELTKDAININNRISHPTEEQQKRDTEILLALLTAPLGGEYAAAKLTPKLAPYLGKQVAKTVATGFGSGLVGGGTEGFSRGLREGENPFISMTRDALLGGLGGTVGGYGFGKVNKYIDANKLRLAQNNKFKSSNKYYSDYERGLNTEMEMIGKVKLTSDGFKETNKNSPEYFDKVIDLNKNLKNAKYLWEEKPIHEHKYPISKFHRFRNDNADYLIAENNKGDNYFHKVTNHVEKSPYNKSLINNEKYYLHLLKKLLNILKK